MIYLLLFWEYFKIGLFSVGGGMATLPFLYDLSDKSGWFTHSQLADMLAVSESTPGPIGINMATYVGYTVGGIPGSFVATFGMVLPGLILTLIIISILSKFRDNKYVNGAFYGLRAASVGLITAAGILVTKIAFFTLPENAGLISLPGVGGLDIKALALGALLLILTRWVPQTKKLHPAIFILCSAVIGILFFGE